jgi:hypothetical protein
MECDSLTIESPALKEFVSKEIASKTKAFRPKSPSYKTKKQESGRQQAQHKINDKERSKDPNAPLQEGHRPRQRPKNCCCCQRFHQQYNKLWQKESEIEKGEFETPLWRSLKVTDKFTHFYIMATVHKFSWTLRPIVSMSGSLTYSLGFWFDQQL